MDILAHALWTTAAGKLWNRRQPETRRVHVAWTAALGVLPDLFAFTWPVVLSIWMGFQTGREVHPDHALAEGLYRYSHSLVLFALVFGALWLLRKRPLWTLLGWPLHILIDIPSHSIDFFPTPFLWPLSGYRFGGVSWGEPWFMTLNYSALVATWVALWFTGRSRAAPEQA